MGGQRKLVEFGEFPDPVVDGAGGLGRLGGVLGHVGGHGLFRQLLMPERANRLNVALGTPPQRAGRVVTGGGHGHGDASGGSLDRIVQESDRRPRRRGGVGTFRTVKTDHRVEVDGAAAALPKEARHTSRRAARVRPARAAISRRR